MAPELNPLLGQPLGRMELAAILLAGEGMSVKEAARVRGVSAHTMQHQRRAAIAKLGAKNIAHAFAIAYRAGLVS